MLMTEPWRTRAAAERNGRDWTWLGADTAPGRFFEGEHVARRVAPFAVCLILPILLLPVLDVPLDDWRVLAAAGIVILDVAAVLLLPWGRLPRWAHAIPVLASFAVIAMLRDASGTDDAVIFEPLLIIPIAFLSLYGTRGMLIAGTAGLAATMIVPAVAIGAPTYPDSHIVRALIAVVIVATTGSAVQSLVGSMRRLATESRSRENALREAEERFRRAFEDNRVGMALISPGGEFERVNSAFCELLGYGQSELVGRGFPEITHSDDIGHTVTAVDEIVAGERYGFRTEKRCKHAQGHYVWSAVNVSSIRDEQGELVQLIAQIEDITELKEQEAKLTHQALHDPLTGLPNRILFADRVRVASARRESGSYGVIYIDLDTFKPINDTFGHSAGDEVLIEVARRLEERLREGDTLARLGGDEFAILCEDTDEAAARLVAERVIEAFSSPFEVAGREIRQAASIGVSVQPRDGRTADPEEVLRRADAAMYRAKATGKSRYSIFEGWMAEGHPDRGGLERELRTAIAKGELTVYYQPEIDLASGQVAGAEALVRWEHPERGLLEPADFMFVAEATDLIVAIDDFVLWQACHEASRWRRDRGPDRPFQISVNLSERRLAEPGLSNKIAQAIADADLPADALCLEIAERAVLDRRGGSLIAFPDLSDLGVRLLIDDFGIALSSFSTIQRLPRLNGIKIDSSFIAGLGRSSEDSVGVAAIVGLAHGLKLVATAEGVETAAQLAELRELGCDRAQGYHFAHPQPPEAFTKLLKSAAYGELIS